MALLALLALLAQWLAVEMGAGFVYAGRWLEGRRAAGRW